jgi:Zn-finger nucleic acid-binding protein
MPRLAPPSWPGYDGGVTCPRCHGELKRATLADMAVQLCPDCAGVLVSQGILIPVLSAVGRALATEIDVDTTLEAVEDPGAGLSCPRCRRPMINFGYMGTNLVFLDRCERCEHVWADGQELGAAALLAARTDLRRDKRVQEFREEFEAMSDRFDAVLVARSVRATLFRMSIFL